MFLIHFESLCVLVLYATPDITPYLYLISQSLALGDAILTSTFDGPEHTTGAPAWIRCQLVGLSFEANSIGLNRGPLVPTAVHADRPSFIQHRVALLFLSFCS